MSESARLLSGPDTPKRRQSQDVTIKSAQTYGATKLENAPPLDTSDLVRRTSSVSRCTLSWHAIRARVKLAKPWITSGSDQYKTDTKMILKDVFGYVEPGTMVAIMGSSGAGKTTLLNILTRKNLGGGGLQWSGHVRVNGEPVTKKTLRAISAYVQQDDLFVPTLTVREHLEFHALMRMGRSFTNAERQARVQSMITQLNLLKCENSLIGDPLAKRGISGGERKRLAFATELLTNPSIMFCDEPTSGLDSFMALQVISVLKDESRMGKTIISTIHQPSSQVFELFDIIYLMGEGRVVFAGPPTEAVKFFERVGYPSPGNFNPADHYIRTLAIVPKRERQCRKRVRDMSSAFKNSAEGTTYSDKAASDWDSGSTMAQSAIVSIRQQTANEQLYKATWLQQVTGLVKRSSLSVLRDPLLLRIRLYQALVGHPTLVIRVHSA